MTGIARIASTFARARAEGRGAFMPYWPVGYPDIPTSLAILEDLAAAGADLIEVGVPFSDPLADGPTIQAATQQALGHGVTPATCLETVRTLRAHGVTVPLVLMGYVNPILAYGSERFVAAAAAAGADGLIVPDLPPDEAAEIEALCQQHGLAFICLVAPTSTPERIALAAGHSRGFLYLVSVTGITGARAELPRHLAEFVGRVRQHTDLPLAVGFGISTPDQAEAVAAIADGVIVGSALIRQANGANPRAAVAALATSLAQAVHRPRHG
ncbi:MAG: tryptophan synthase subunit alpha [Caldilineales bacterium]|nr:tryptophan synthase subunit alpha [Caldilineales bacterium]